MRAYLIWVLAVDSWDGFDNESSSDKLLLYIITLLKFQDKLLLDNRASNSQILLDRKYFYKTQCQEFKKKLSIIVYNQEKERSLDGWTTYFSHSAQDQY